MASQLHGKLSITGSIAASATTISSNHQRSSHQQRPSAAAIGAAAISAAAVSSSVALPSVALHGSVALHSNVAEARQRGQAPSTTAIHHRHPPPPSTTGSMIAARWHLDALGLQYVSVEDCLRTSLDALSEAHVDAAHDVGHLALRDGRAQRSVVALAGKVGASSLHGEVRRGEAR